MYDARVRSPNTPLGQRAGFRPHDRRERESEEKNLRRRNLLPGSTDRAFYIFVGTYTHIHTLNLSPPEAGPLFPERGVNPLFAFLRERETTRAEKTRGSLPRVFRATCANEAIDAPHLQARFTEYLGILAKIQSSLRNKLITRPPTSRKRGTPLKLYER